MRQQFRIMNQRLRRLSEKEIKNADRTEGGWKTVKKYETGDYADNSDDDKNIRQTNTRALQKKRHLQPRWPAMVLSNEANRRSIFLCQQKQQDS